MPVGAWTHTNARAREGQARQTREVTSTTSNLLSPFPLALSLLISYSFPSFSLPSARYGNRHRTQGTRAHIGGHVHPLTRERAWSWVGLVEIQWPPRGMHARRRDVGIIFFCMSHVGGSLSVAYSQSVHSLNRIEPGVCVCVCGLPRRIYPSL